MRYLRGVGGPVGRCDDVVGVAGCRVPIDRRGWVDLPPQCADAREARQHKYEDGAVSCSEPCEKHADCQRAGAAAEASQPAFEADVGAPGVQVVDQREQRGEGHRRKGEDLRNTGRHREPGCDQCEHRCRSRREAAAGVTEARRKLLNDVRSRTRRAGEKRVALIADDVANSNVAMASHPPAVPRGASAGDRRPHFPVGDDQRIGDEHLRADGHDHVDHGNHENPIRRRLEGETGADLRDRRSRTTAVRIPCTRH